MKMNGYGNVTRSANYTSYGRLLSDGWVTRWKKSKLASSISTDLILQPRILVLLIHQRKEGLVADVDFEINILCSMLIHG